MRKSPQSAEGWKNGKGVSEVLCNRRMNVKIKGECVQNSGIETSTVVCGRDMGVEEGSGK